MRIPRHSAHPFHSKPATCYKRVATQEMIDRINKELGTDYRDYLSYIEDNIGDDASFTMEELKALLGEK